MKIEDRWITRLNPRKLVPIAPAIAYLEMGHVTTMDEVAQFMVKGGAEVKTFALKNDYGGRFVAHAETRPPKDKRPPKKYWLLVKHEFHLFLCTNDRKYGKLRRKLRSYGKKSEAMVISLIAAAIGSSIGVMAGVIAGFCAVCLYGVVKMGKEAFCAYLQSA